MAKKVGSERGQKEGRKGAPFLVVVLFVLLCTFLLAMLVRYYADSNQAPSMPTVASSLVEEPKGTPFVSIDVDNIKQTVNLQDLLSRNYTLKEAVKNAAGKGKTIIFVSASRGYLDFLENWFASVEKLGHGSMVLFIAEDEDAYIYMKSKWPKRTVRAEDALVRDVASQVQSADTTEAQTYGTGVYNALVDRRPEYFKRLIDLKVNFLYSDVDIVLQKDPFPFFTGEYDMWVQEDAVRFQGAWRFKDGIPAKPIRDKWHSICTCFMYVRPTRRSRFLIHRWSRHVADMAKRWGGPVLNQPAFNKALALTPDRDVSVGVLPVLNFPSGYLYFKCGGEKACRRNKIDRTKFWEAARQDDKGVVMVHNNWVQGHAAKLNRFKTSKLWLIGTV